MSLRHVLVGELKDLYSAENQLVKALPKTAKAAQSTELKQVLLTHHEETKAQVERLKQIFEILDKKPTGKHCKGMEGAIDEVKEALDEDEEGAVFDAGIIGGSIRVEHYEIAGYTAAIAMARQLGEAEVAGLLTQTLAEETNAARQIMTAAKGILKAAHAAEADEPKAPEKKAKGSKEKKLEAASEQEERKGQGSVEDGPEEAGDAAPARKSKSKK